MAAVMESRVTGGALRVLEEADALLNEYCGRGEEYDDDEVAAGTSLPTSMAAYRRSVWELRTTKSRFIAMETNHHMERLLSGDEEGRQADAARIESQLTETQHEVKELKGECVRVEEKLESAIDALCDGLQQLEAARDALRSRLATRHHDTNPNRRGEENKVDIQQRVEKLRVVEESLGLQRKAIAQYRTLLAGDDSELARANETAERQRRQLAEREWETRAAQLMRGLCGMRLLPGSTRELLSVEMTPRGAAAPFRLDLFLRPDGTVADVQTSCTMLGIEHLCAGGAGGSSVHYILAKIRCRYEGQTAIVAEIKHLQSRFAVDWQVSESKMRVLLGATASVVCTVQAPPGYPTTGGGATLLSVKGIEPCPDVATLRPPQESPTLTDWIVYLQWVFA